MVNKLNLKQKLNLLGLTDNQAEIYLLLLKQGLTSLLELSRRTNINRTTIYRIVEDLKKLNLAEEVLDDRGTKVKAVNPENLEFIIANKEAELTNLKSNLSDLITNLSAIKDQPVKSTQVVYFHGQSGLKQLLWNCVKAGADLVGYGYADWNASVGKEFAEKLRAEIIKQGRHSREIQNDDQIDPKKTYTSLADYRRHHEARGIPKSLIEIKHDTYIYNDVFAFYYFIGDELFGLEIHNQEIAKTQKQIFEVLWKLAKKINVDNK